VILSRLGRSRGDEIGGEAIGGREEGTRTWPDYLVNREYQKKRGHSGKKILQKSRNICKVNGRGCGCTGTVDSRRNYVQS